MKTIFTIISAVILTATVWAQIPQKMSYQAVIRNSSNQPLTNQIVGMKISILQGSISGASVYNEIQTPSTNANGLVTIEIGNGAGFNAINWANGPYFIKTETDPTGGTNYTITGTSQLLSVPYALYAKTAETLSGEITETDPVFGASSAKGITSTNTTNWTAAYGWGNHANAGYLKVFTETDPLWIAASSNYYTKSNMQTSGSAQLHFNNLTNKPTTIAGYGITDADSSTTNEIQSLSLAGNDLTLSKGGGTVTLPSYSGDNWGIQSVVTDPTLTGNGTTFTPLKISQQAATAGQVLKWNGISWVPGTDMSSSSGWSLTGNNGTSSSTDFIGTIDNVPFSIRVNNQLSGKIDPLLYNTSFGYQSLSSNTTGQFNTAVGIAALNSNSSGNENSAMGQVSLGYNTIGNGNTAAGSRSLFSNSEGNMNTAIGLRALYFNTKNNRSTAIGVDAMFNADDNTKTVARETYNTAVGYEALKGSNTAGNNTGRYNTAIGDQAMYANTTGEANAAFGNQALYSNTTGNINTAAGNQALTSNTTGYQNTAFGYRALFNNNTGNYNTAIGNAALPKNTTGNGNIAIGLAALISNTSGSNNSGIGNSALNYNTTGNNNIAIGSNALFYNSQNHRSTVIGIGAMYNADDNSSSPARETYNTAIGYEALRGSNTPGNNIGQYNTSIGDQALYSNTSGYYNTANGFHALFSNTTGNFNTANGSAALYSNTTGYENTANGVAALYSNTTGNRNTANGYEALYSNTTGYENTAFGRQALVSNTAGYGNTAIGFRADVTKSALTNATAVGYDAEVDASNKVRIGNTSVSSIGGQVGWTAFSDGRFKKNINENVPGLEFINQLRPVTYTLDITTLNADINKNKSTTLRDEGEKVREESADERAGIAAQERIIYTGFVAQEVESAAKIIGYDFSGVDAPQNANGHYGLRYAEFVVPLVKGMQEQQQMIEEMKKTIEQLQLRVEQLEGK